MAPTKVSKKELESAHLEQFLQAKQSAEVEEYTQVGTKDSGVSQGGFIGSRNEQAFMLKPGAMNPKSATETIDRNSVIYEYMAPFERFLYDRAPAIGAATKADKENIEAIYLRSKMIDNSEILDNYISFDYKFGNSVDQATNSNQVIIFKKNGKLMWCRGDDAPQEIKISDKISEGISQAVYENILNNQQLSANAFNQLKQHGIYQFGYRQEGHHFEGLEKILAASMFCGDHDYHPKNILVTERDGEKVLVKIDHGKAIHFYDNNQSLRKMLYNGTNRSLYQKMDIDAVKLKESIDEMCKISDQEIETLIKARSYQLRKMGFKLDDDITYYVNGKPSKLAEGYKLRLFKNVNTDKPLTTGQIALGIEDGKLICQVYGKAKIEINNQPELKTFIEKAERGENPGDPASYLAKAIEHLNANHKGYILPEQELRYTNLEQNYIKLYKNQREALKNLSKDLELVIDMDKSEEWKKREWLQDVRDSDVKEWATANDVSFQTSSNNALTSEQLILQIESLLFKNDIESIKKLITEYNNPDIADREGNTILHKAIEENNQNLVEFLLQRKADPNIANQEGAIPIFVAIQSGSSEIINLLHKNGADLNYMSKDGLTPLYVAMLQENQETIDQLIKLGADPTKKPDCIANTEWQDLCKQYINKGQSKSEYIIGKSPVTTVELSSYSSDRNSLHHMEDNHNQEVKFAQLLSCFEQSYSDTHTNMVKFSDVNEMAHRKQKRLSRSFSNI